MDSPRFPLRHALRSLLRAPGFSLTVIATLALALGPGVALLSLADQIFWRQLPLPAPEELVVFEPPHGPFSGQTNQWSDFSMVMSYPEYRDFAEWGESPFTGIAARAPVVLALEEGAHTEPIDAEIVSGNYFDVLKVSAAKGRLLAPSDDVRRGDHPVTVLSWGTWQRRFDGDPGIVGRTISLNGHPMTVVGVTERDFRSLELEFAPEVWVTMAMKPVATPLYDDLDKVRSRWLNTVARLSPGVTREAAEERTNAYYRTVSAGNVDEFNFSTSTDARKRYLDRHMELLSAARGRSDLRGDDAVALIAVLGLVGLLFALACANLANLFASRYTRLQRDFTVRLALGSTRGALAGRILAEAGILSTLAVVAGAALALVLPSRLPEILPPGFGGLAPEVDPTLLLFGALLALVATLGCGLLPALVATRGEISERLRTTATAALGGRGAARTRRLLVGLQVGLSTAILIGAGLLVRSLVRLADRDPGFDSESVVQLRVDPRLAGYEADAERTTVDRLQRELEALPGVVSVGRSELIPLSNSIARSSLTIPGVEFPDEDRPAPRIEVVTADYFTSLGIPLHSGRSFDERDREGGAPTALVNRAFVERYLKGESPLGRTIDIGPRHGLAVVGVVGDVLFANLREDFEPFVYLPYGQFHTGDATVFLVRGRGRASDLVETVQRKVSEVAPDVPLAELRPLADQARRSLALERATASIAAALGLMAALLAAIGLYGVLAFTVDARRRELAVRTALGALPSRLGAWVVAHASRPVVGGLVAGTALAFAGSRLLSSLLFNVPPRDPLTFVSVGLTVLAVSALATVLPALRALRLEPALVLRDE